MKNYQDMARDVFQTEMDELLKVQSRINSNFDEAIRLISGSTGKVVILAIGKSGLVAQKIAATLTSTGTPAVFIHATEALHGDLGLIRPEDVLIIISNTGTSPEIIALLPHLRSLGSPIIAMTGNLQSKLAAEASIVLDIGVEQEACKVKHVPTASTTTTLVMGDALASALVEMKDFTEDRFAAFHPGGGIGRRLKLKIGDLMHPVAELPLLSVDGTFDEIIETLNTPTKTGIFLGAVLLVDPDLRLMGLITWGDIRVALTMREAVFRLKAIDIMKADPVTIGPETPAIDALRLMENRERPMSVLPIVAKERLVGFIKIQDILGKV